MLIVSLAGLAIVAGTAAASEAMVLVWACLALMAGVVVVVLGFRLFGGKAPSLPADVELPATQLQRMSRWALAAGALLSAAAATVLLRFGPATTYGDDRLRVAFTLLLVGILAVFGAVTVRVWSWRKRDDGTLDERDRAIVDRAPAVQSAATMVTLAIWMIGLTEAFSGQGVPVYYLYLVFWSCVVINLLGLPIGILLGFRKGS